MAIRSPTPDRRPGTILLADANPVALKVMATVLVEAGFQVVGKSTGAACIRAARRHRPDLVVMDMDFTDLDGLAVCRAVKSDSASSGIPVVCITASTQEAALQEAFEAGAADFIRKPVFHLELLLRVKSVLARSRESTLKGVLEMAGAVCHELNQPLQTITGYCDLVLLGNQIEGDSRKKVAQIRDEIDRMGRLTRQLMGITRYRTRKYSGGVQIIDIEKASEQGE
jgi:CheY-like chemotaxis protein